MDIFYHILALLGGLALFLYGMQIMGTGLRNSSSSALKVALSRVTSNQVVGFLFGLIVTCVIQSSNATIVLTVGLVGAGLLTFRQSVGIVLGANVGTAITAQIIRLMDVDASSDSILALFQAKNLSSIALIAGVIMIMFVNTHKSSNTGTILAGFGILFVGIMNMSSAVSTMGDRLSTFLTAFEGNYFMGTVAGFFVTLILQSSSAVVGIIQTIASTEGIRFCGLFSVIIGVNMGACIATFIVCRIGAKTEQIRICVADIIYNVLAALFIYAVVGILRVTGIINDDIWYMTLRSGGVANVHGLFRLVPALVFLPFANPIADLAEKILREKPMEDEDADIVQNLRELDRFLVSTPGMALNESEHLIYHMAQTAAHNVEACFQQLKEYDPKRDIRMQEREVLLDRMADETNQYVVALSPKITTDADSRNQYYQMNAIVSFERMGDHAINIQKQIDLMAENRQTFSAKATQELEVLGEAIRNIVNLTVSCVKSGSLTDAERIEPMEQAVDALIKEINSRHMKRMTKGKCSIDSGIKFENITTNLERISDMCSDYAVYLLGRSNPQIVGREHEHIDEMHISYDAGYEQIYNSDVERYFSMLDSDSSLKKSKDKAVTDESDKKAVKGKDSGHKDKSKKSKNKEKDKSTGKNK